MERRELASLSEREKQVLRLLVRGHDAKSSARELALSVHIVNEYLRDARRKLEVSSSREAARLLAQSEQGESNALGTSNWGLDTAAATLVNDGTRLVWIIGGLLVMSLIIAAAALYAAFHAGTASEMQSIAAKPAIPDSERPQVSVARDWVGLLDHQRWNESWNAAGALFKSHVAEPSWGSMVESVRQPLGPVSSRVVESATRTTTAQGLPDGDYEVVQFQTDFAHKPHATETVFLAHEPSGWRVDGYFIR